MNFRITLFPRITPITVAPKVLMTGNNTEAMYTGAEVTVGQMTKRSCNIAKLCISRS